MTLRAFLLLSCLAVLASCSGIKPFSAGKPQIVAAPDSVSAMLADAADRSSRALESLASVETARGPAVMAAPVGNAPSELRRAITVNWTGSVEEITQILAERASYRFEIMGAVPPVPMVVRIDVQNKPVIEVLRDVGLQLGMRADLRVDGARKVVELHYAPNTGVGPAL